MFCPGCGHPHSKGAKVCSDCDRYLTPINRQVAKKPFAHRTQAERLLVAKQEASILRIPQQGARETVETFIERVRDARTQQLQELVKQMEARA